MAESGAWTNWVNIANNEGGAGADLVILPPPSEIIENGIKKVTQYRKDVDEESGEVNYYKVVNCFQLLQVSRRISKNAITRKSLNKFGACEGVGPGPEKGITTVCPDYIPLEWDHEKMGEEEEEDNAVLNKLLQKSAAHSLLEDIAPKHVIEGESKKKNSSKRTNWIRTWRPGPLFGRTPNGRNPNHSTLGHTEKHFIRRFTSSC